MPPVEKNGKQVALVDVNDSPIKTVNYLAARQQAATSGQVYNPEVGFALVGNVAGGGLKYPYNPFYASFSPRVAVAWNPHISADSFMSKIFGEDATVIRGGYGRVYGRLNGVGLVLTPLLGSGPHPGGAMPHGDEERYVRFLQSNGYNGVPHWCRRNHGSACCCHDDTAATPLSWIQRRCIRDRRCARS